MGGDPVNGVDPSGLRELNQDETQFLEGVFGDSIDLGSIEILVSPTGRGVSPIDSVVMLPADDFVGSDLALGVDMNSTRALGTLAHEVFHVWQRQAGRPVTVVGLFEQGLYECGVDVYDYDRSLVGQELLDLFLTTGIEAQAQIFEDGVRAHLSGDAGGYSDVLEYVRTWEYEPPRVRWPWQR